MRDNKFDKIKMIFYPIDQIFVKMIPRTTRYNILSETTL